MLLQVTTASSLPSKSNLYPFQIYENPIEPAQLLALSLKTATFNHPLISSRLISLYTHSKSTTLDHVRSVFDQFQQPTLFSWNTLIKSYVQNQRSQESLFMFLDFMTRSGLMPDVFTLPCVIKACGRLMAVKEGAQIHGLVFKLGLGSDLFVQGSLVGMYSKFKDIGSARKVFDQMTERDLVTWNSLMDGYVKDGEIELAMELFDEMTERDVVSWTVMVDGLSKCGRVDDARKVFDEMPRRNFASWNAMINGYMRAGDFISARGLFDVMEDKDIITWNSMIAGYEHNGRCSEALKLFTELLNLGYVPTHSTLVSTLSAISWSALLSKGRWVHSYMVKNGHKLDGVLGTSLIEMYCKCGSIETALKVFESIPNKKLGHWTTIIAGLGTHGQATLALDLFLEMLKMNVIPNAITFIGVLTACNHAGLVEDGRRYFNMMIKDYKIEPTVEHYGCLVDILCRAGHLEEAKNVIESMPLKPNKVIWMSLLSASRIYKKVEIGEYAAQNVTEIDPNFIESYVLLSNMYAATGNWDKVSRVRDAMRKTGVKKDPGCSLIEYRDEVHEFIAGDKSHPRTHEIYHKLSEIRERLKSVGYVPDKSQVLLHIEGDDEKESELESHSERLAIAFGLISLKPGIPIRIVKNLRVCNDCHSVTKHLSQIYDREIIVRDNSRFHHFKHGSCSCMDYW
ncbi:putative tetratricopeptide-like helical domain superfamily, DYW domain-containing protein [Helianthus annuus]|nr:putative tetratricopeptide-like helical domain superfamily, DYW domain-containing protein [Helianthus annuus]KAJ0554674.1 putative tetratricopeptide-like helical domain superfamily, DYW domain-containing protein [Helianthus annuus]KAJ0720236.1 putative tetratricopeptide-like helical domain superfamily, DYW domain-containing protein [Helianthus annuus]KAJ0723455.1 putative tetratricopeptide-like helical domain superfamily, DYW domain-containing protein [Helianthus annuus]KAJ0899243.1 putative